MQLKDRLIKLIECGTVIEAVGGVRNCEAGIEEKDSYGNTLNATNVAIKDPEALSSSGKRPLSPSTHSYGTSNLRNPRRC